MGRRESKVTLMVFWWWAIVLHYSFEILNRRHKKMGWFITKELAVFTDDVIVVDVRKDFPFSETAHVSLVMHCPNDGYSEHFHDLARENSSLYDMNRKSWLVSKLLHNRSDFVCIDQSGNFFHMDPGNSEISDENFAGQFNGCSQSTLMRINQLRELLPSMEELALSASLDLPVTDCLSDAYLDAVRFAKLSLVTAYDIEHSNERCFNTYVRGNLNPTRLTSDEVIDLCLVRYFVDLGLLLWSEESELNEVALWANSVLGDIEYEISIDHGDLHFSKS